MSWYLIELTDGALTPYATETETDWAARIRKAVGGDCRCRG